MSVTIHDVANAAGFSIATVSRVLNKRNHPVSESTRQRILDVAEELGYHPNVAARILRTDRSCTVGIISDDITGIFTPLIIRGIQDVLREAGYLCVIINAGWDPDRERTAIRDLISRSIDGVVFVESWHRTANEELEIANKPYVFAHRQFAAVHSCAVTPDEVYNARLAVRHLVGLGHRSIGYINGPPHFYASAERMQGYQDELRVSGLPFDPDLVVDGDWELQSGYRGMQRLLNQRPLPTAVFAANDQMAVGALYAIADAGLSVPDDIALVGYDDRAIATAVRPQLTTVTLPCYQMGEASAQMLIHQMKENATTLTERKIRGQLIVRASCGAAEQQEARGNV